MDEDELDNVDRSILHVLQRDARITKAEISDRIGVTASTVGKRLRSLEENGVIRGYRPEIDYERAGLPLQVLFICTAPIAEREDLINETHGIRGVVNTRELMTGEGNVHILVTGASNEDITRIAQTIDQLGYVVNDEILMRNEHVQPSTLFYDPKKDG